VKEAVDIAGRRELAYKEKAKELGRTPTLREKVEIDLDILGRENRYGPDVATALQKKLAKISDPAELERFHDAVLERYAGKKPLREWDSDVRYVASFTKPILTAKLRKLGSLTEQKTVTGNPETLYQAGRQALAYNKARLQRQREMDGAPSNERAVRLAELRAWEDSQDNAIKVNGKVVAPSPLRIAWANLTDEERAEHIASTAKRSWGLLTNFDKEILGKQVQPGVSAAWAIIAQQKDDYRNANFASVAADQLYRAGGGGLMQQLENYKDAKGNQPYAGIAQDYLFSRKPLYQRLEVMPLVAKSPHRKQWQELFANAAVVNRAWKSDVGYTKSELAGYWRQWLVSADFQSWLNESPGFRRELEPFGPDLLNSLIN
jgi:hypothetical protein